MKNKIIDCVTFFKNNFIFELRYNILKNFVDYFIVCESHYDHKGRKKSIDFKNMDNLKIKHIIMEDEFKNLDKIWENQAQQRDYILKNLDFASPDDYIFFSDPDEIPDPDILSNFKLEKKYGIFLQKCFNYKFNLFNKYESPWEGTRVCKKKDLKSIDFMRQKVKSKNLNYNFLRFDKEKNIELFSNGGWHFNNIMSAEDISRKLITFAHKEFSSPEFSSTEIIRDNINKRKDLFKRGHIYEKVELDNSFPKYLYKNKKLYEDFIL